MKKNVVLTRLTVFNEDFQMYEGIRELLVSLNKEGHSLIVISHSQHSIGVMNRIFRNTFDYNITCVYRNYIRANVDESNAKDYVLIGSCNEDLILAANKRILIINPAWSIKQDEKPARYGITLNRPEQLFEAIRLIANQNKWYFKLDVDEDTTVLALTSANTLNRDVIHTEREILEGFEGLLKAGDRRYFNTLYFHLISGVMKNPELRNVDIWGTFPSSSSIINDEVEELKERCRYLTGRKMTQPLFIRHTPVEKSHETAHEIRLTQGCTKHFNSIILNPYYNSSRIRGKVVCVIDDYLTNGPSFETARNLLLKAGASKVILLALGRYRRGVNGIYQYEVYNITGKITVPHYRYQLVSRRNLVGEYDTRARDEVKRIHEILND
ncbi:phosphoribosyltransferase [Neobacillus mesonae]|uniref:Phosphoribosyltransferase n=1 Tax=Neobacillus mesonae TaxID=1193713 RepID=A0A3Q9QX83_9BACI|nr:phosphoribosyltransferase [Neobacillus mesonae]AZU62568.1 hypothetical protein CHR53_15550 [Neobacillus mesonae]